MNQLETLLNSLIKMGWKPWGKGEANECTVESQKQVCVWSKYYRMLRKGSLRELVSLESGLWQFVCKNNLMKISESMEQEYRKAIRSKTADFETWHLCCEDENPEYRLIESALVSEGELGKFLVDNIVVIGQ